MVHRVPAPYVRTNGGAARRGGGGHDKAKAPQKWACPPASSSNSRVTMNPTAQRYIDGPPEHEDDKLVLIENCIDFTTLYIYAF